MAAYTRPEFEAFRVRQRRAWSAGFVVLIGVAVAAALTIGAAGSYLAGLIVAVVIALVGFEVLRRWNRARWLRHFPELRDRSFPWVRGTH